MSVKHHKIYFLALWTTLHFAIYLIPSFAKNFSDKKHIKMDIPIFNKKN